MNLAELLRDSAKLSQFSPAQIAAPQAGMPTQQKIATLVRQSFTLKALNERLLQVAKRAVEIAIEKNKDAGMAYLVCECASA